MHVSCLKVTSLTLGGLSWCSLVSWINFSVHTLKGGRLKRVGTNSCSNLLEITIVTILSYMVVLSDTESQLYALLKLNFKVITVNNYALTLIITKYQNLRNNDKCLVLWI